MVQCGIFGQATAITWLVDALIDLVFSVVDNFGDFRDCISPFHPSFSEEFSNNCEGTLFYFFLWRRKSNFTRMIFVHHFGYL